MTSNERLATLDWAARMLRDLDDRADAERFNYLDDPCELVARRGSFSARKVA